MTWLIYGIVYSYHCVWLLPSVANSDITVVCGTERMELQILLCPVYFGGYNESLMALNARYNNPKCRGIPDLNADPPVLKFNFSITEEAVAECSNKLTVKYVIRQHIFFCPVFTQPLCFPPVYSRLVHFSHKFREVCQHFFVSTLLINSW